MIREPKTEKSVRYVPMTDGHAGFLCPHKKGMPMAALHLEKHMTPVASKYSKTYRVPLPRITPLCVGIPSAPIWQSRDESQDADIIGPGDISATPNPSRSFR